MPMNDPVSSAVQEVVELFTGELGKLRFGDLEGPVLARAAEDVKVVAAEVATAECMLEAARARLAEKQDALMQKAQRALAYARVYAEGHPELAARLDQIAIPRAARRAARFDAATFDADELTAGAGEATARRRGRPRKIDNGAALLALPADVILDPVATG
jgi:ElaB/YqjD/DUF883 family membrane-anchored ribosome-binding protein